MTEQQRICSVEDCQGKVLARKMCSLHYQRWMKFGRLHRLRAEDGLPLKFLMELQPSDECILWPYYKEIPFGYGMLNYNGKSNLAHRVSYQIHCKVELSADQCLLHQCDTPSCVNPRHLKIGTRTENQQEMKSRGRGKGNKGRKLTAEKVMEIHAIRGTLTINEIAEKFGVHRQSICGVFSGRTWKHVPRDIE